MLNDSVTALKMLSTGINRSSNTFEILTQSSRPLQIQITMLVTVSGFEKDSAVIFTTPDGEKLTAKTNMNLNQGDQVRVYIDENKQYHVVSISQKNEEVKTPAQDVYVKYTKSAELLGVKPNSKDGSIPLLNATFVDYDPDIDAIENDSELLAFFKKNPNFKLKVISLEDHQVASDKKSGAFGVVDILNEIQKENVGDKFSFPARVESSGKNNVILRSAFGSMKVDMDLSVYLNRNIIVRAEGNNEDKVDNNINKLLSSSSLFASNLMKSSGSISSKEILHLIYSLYDKSNISHNSTKSKLFKSNLKNIREEFQESSFLKNFEPESYGWLYNFINFDSSSSNKQSIYFKKEDEDTSRIIFDLDLENINNCQAEIIISHQNESDNDAESRVKHIKVVFKFKEYPKNNMHEKLIETVQDVLSNIEVQHSVTARISDDFYVFNIIKSEDNINDSSMDFTRYKKLEI